MATLKCSHKVHGVYNQDTASHYVLADQAPAQTDALKAKGLIPVSYCFYQGKWREDLAYLSHESLRQVVDFADQRNISVHHSYRSYLA